MAMECGRSVRYYGLHLAAGFDSLMAAILPINPVSVVDSPEMHPSLGLMSKLSLCSSQHYKVDF